MKKSADYPYKVNCRISEKAYEKLVQLLKESQTESMSSLIRNILENRKIRISQRDESLDALMEAFLSFDTEFQKIGESLTELRLQLNGAGSVAAKLYLAGKIDRTLGKLREEHSRIEELILPFTKKWLQK